jgi:hypothetical protein
MLNWKRNSGKSLIKISTTRRLYRFWLLCSAGIQTQQIGIAELVSTRLSYGNMRDHANCRFKQSAENLTGSQSRQR